MGHGPSRGVVPAKKSWKFLATGRIFGLLGVILPALGASAPATDLIGKVTNGTTNKAVDGDEVMLLSVSKGSAKETASARTDSAGRFRFIGTDPPTRRLVRVVQQGVVHDKMAKPDVNFRAVKVYDVAGKLDGVTAVMDVQRFEARSDTLI